MSEAMMKETEDMPTVAGMLKRIYFESNVIEARLINIKLLFTGEDHLGFDAPRMHGPGCMLGDAENSLINLRVILDLCDEIAYLSGQPTPDPVESEPRLRVSERLNKELVKVSAKQGYPAEAARNW